MQFLNMISVASFIILLPHPQHWDADLDGFPSCRGSVHCDLPVPTGLPHGRLPEPNGNQWNIRGKVETSEPTSMTLKWKPQPLQLVVFECLWMPKAVVLKNLPVNLEALHHLQQVPPWYRSVGPPGLPGLPVPNHPNHWVTGPATKCIPRDPAPWDSQTSKSEWGWYPQLLPVTGSVTRSLKKKNKMAKYDKMLQI